MTCATVCRTCGFTHPETDCPRWPADCSHRNGAIDWDTGAWHCYGCGAYVYDEPAS